MSKKLAGMGAEGADQELTVKMEVIDLFDKFCDERTKTISMNEFFELIQEASEETRTGCTILHKRVETMKKKKNIRHGGDLVLGQKEFLSLFDNNLADYSLYDLVWDMIDDNKTGFIQYEELRAAKNRYGLMLLDDKDLMQMIDNLKNSNSNSVQKDDLFNTLYGAQ